MSLQVSVITIDLPGPVGEQFVQQTFPGAGDPQTVQGLALADFSEGDHVFTNDQLLVGGELVEIVQQLIGNSSHQRKMHCAGRKVKKRGGTVHTAAPDQ